MLSSGHLLLILVLLVVVLAIWGPGKLPDVGAGMGRAIREFRKAASDVTDSPSPTTPKAVATPAAPQSAPSVPDATTPPTTPAP